MLLLIVFFIFFAVDIAATDAGDRAVVRRKLLFDFGYFFFIHNLTTLSI